MSQRVMRRDGRREEGFTLIEIMVVIAIIATLMGLVVVGIPYISKKSKESQTKSRINEIAALMQLVKGGQNLGEYPPTQTSRLMLGNQKIGKEVGQPNMVNVGIETIAVVFFMNEIDLGDRISTDYLENYDGDMANKNIVIHQVNDLFEIKDAFEQPLIYFHSSEYKPALEGRAFLVSTEEMPVEGEEVVPWTDAATGGFKNPGSFQIFSLGHDGRPNTEDDIGNFETD